MSDAPPGGRGLPRPQGGEETSGHSDPGAATRVEPGGPASDEVVAALLEARGPEDDLEDRRVRAAVERRLFSRPVDPVRIDRYVILQRIGSGGIGVVYAAYDPRLDRKVALKLLRPSSAGSQDSHAADRLLREAHSLARLSHPNVIAVYDTGTYREQVYIAMELVEGEDLTAWVARRPPWRKVRDVFLAAGRALAAAHRAGLVHRDFKPANVLIDREGRVRVLDFGLAKLVRAPSVELVAAEPTPVSGAEADALTADLTVEGTIMGTPAYMAPEQHRAEEVGPATDQYAFCIALFEALHGRRPFEASDVQTLLARKEAGEIVQGAGRVPRWLDRVARRGLAPRPEDRYASMDELLRALDRDPARSALRWGTGGAVAAALAGVFVLGRAGADPCQSVHERAAALWDEDSRARVEAAFLASGALFARRALQAVEQGVARYAREWGERRLAVCQRAADGERTHLTEETICLERSYVALQQLVGVLAEADADVVEHAAFATESLPALDVCARLGRASPPAPAQATAQSRPAEVALARGRALARAGKYRQARAELERAQAQAPDDDDPVRAQVAYEVGRVLDDLGEAEAAERSLLRAVVLAERRGDDRLATQALIELVYTVGVSASRHDEGLRLAELARAKLARSGEDPRLVALLENHRGVILTDASRLDEAREAHEKALALRTELYGSDSLPVASSLNNLGRVAQAQGNHAAALDIFRRARDIYVRELGSSHPNSLSARGNVAVALLRLGKPAEAEPEFRALIAEVEARGEATHPRLAMLHNSLASSLRDQGHLKEARAAFERARDAARRSLGPRHFVTLGITTNLAGIMVRLGEYEPARALVDQVIRDASEAVGRDHPIVALAYETLGDLERGEGNLAAAREAYEQCLQRRVASLGPDHADVRSVRELLAELEREPARRPRKRPRG